MHAWYSMVKQIIPFRQLLGRRRTAWYRRHKETPPNRGSDSSTDTACMSAGGWRYLPGPVQQSMNSMRSGCPLHTDGPGSGSTKRGASLAPDAICIVFACAEEMRRADVVVWRCVGCNTGHCASYKTGRCTSYNTGCCVGYITGRGVA